MPKGYPNRAQIGPETYQKNNVESGTEMDKGNYEQLCFRSAKSYKSTILSSKNKVSQGLWSVREQDALRNNIKNKK